jgi:uncharacterized membrane protein YhhN
MGKRFWLIAYGIGFAADLLLVWLQQPEARVFTKPLLMILLGLYCFTAAAKGRERTLILLALLFSWLGDVLLLRDSQPLFFMLGLGAFLTAHIFYILYFLRVRGQLSPTPAWKPFWILLILLYAVALVYLLYPRLGDLKIPVLVYATVISTMLIAALHAFDLKKQPWGIYCMYGAAYFVLSDSILAINKFHTHCNCASLLTMLTYGIAQGLIVWGVVEKKESMPLSSGEADISPVI